MTKRVLFSLLPAIVLAGGIELGFRAFFVDASTLDYLAKAADPMGSPDGGGYFWLHTSRVPRVRSRSSTPAPPVGNDDGSLTRIVTIGGSSAAGYPYDPRLAFPNVLRVMLELMYPEARFQVINLARFAAPYSLAARTYLDIADLRPRFLLVYSGHNELYPHNLSQVVERHERTGWRRATDAVAESLGSRSRAVGWLVDRTPQHSDSIPEGFNVFEHLGDMLTNYRETTARIYEAAQENGTAVITATLVRNLRDFPPVPYSETLAEAFPPLDPEGFEALPRNERRDPVQLYRSARWYEAEGELGLAEQRFIEASDRVTRLARVHSAVQSWIEQVEEFYPGVILVEAERFVENANGARMIGDDEIFDWVHPKLSTNYLVASAYFEALRAQLDAELGPAVRDLPPLLSIKPRLNDGIRSLEADGEVEAGFVNVQVGRPDVATLLFERGLDQSPSPTMAVKALVGLALVRILQGDPARARAALDAIDTVGDGRRLLDVTLAHYRHLDGFEELQALIE